MVEQAIMDQNVLNVVQSQLSEKDEQIENVKQKVRKLEREIIDLKEELNSTERAIAVQKNKVHALGSDKRRLQEELEKSKTKVKDLEKRIDSHESQKNSYEAKIECLEQQNYDQETQMDYLRKEIKGLQRDLLRMGEEHQDESNRIKTSFKKRIDQLERQQNKYKPGQELNATEDMAFIKLGAMCHQLQNKMYEKVLPDYFEEKYGNYTVEQLKQHIEDDDSVVDEEDRDAAERWEDLKTEIGWNDNFIRTIASLVKTRNYLAHPSLNEEKLREALDVITKKGRLLKKGYESAEKAAMLINMWVKLCAQ